MSTIIDMTLTEHEIQKLLEAKGIEPYPRDLAEDLFAATPNIADVENDVRRAVEHRERIIVRASGAGLSYRVIADAVGLSYQRVAQIVRKAKENR